MVPTEPEELSEVIEKSASHDPERGCRLDTRGKLISYVILGWCEQVFKPDVPFHEVCLLYRWFQW